MYRQRKRWIRVQERRTSCSTRRRGARRVARLSPAYIPGWIQVAGRRSGHTSHPSPPQSLLDRQERDGCVGCQRTSSTYDTVPDSPHDSMIGLLLTQHHCICRLQRSRCFTALPPLECLTAPSLSPFPARDRSAPPSLPLSRSESFVLLEPPCVRDPPVYPPLNRRRITHDSDARLCNGVDDCTPRRMNAAATAPPL